MDEIKARKKVTSSVENLITDSFLSTSLIPHYIMCVCVVRIANCDVFRSMFSLCCFLRNLLMNCPIYEMKKFPKKRSLVAEMMRMNRSQDWLG